MLISAQSPRHALAEGFLDSLLGYSDKVAKVVTTTKDAVPFSDYYQKKRSDPSYGGSNQEIQRATESGGKVICQSVVGCGTAPVVEKVAQGLGMRQRDTADFERAVYSNDRAALERAGTQMDRTTAGISNIVYGPRRDPSLDMAKSAGGKFGDMVGGGIQRAINAINLTVEFANRMFARPSGGADPSVPRSPRQTQYARPSTAQNTPPGTVCTNYNSPNSSSCNEGAENSASDGGFNGRWSLQDSTCKTPVTITETEIRGMGDNLLGSGYGVTCRGSAITPIQYPNRWRYQLVCSGAAGAVQDMEYRFNQIDADRLRFNVCVYGASCGPGGTLTRCK